MKEDSSIISLGGQERTNYPFVISVEDGGDSLGITAQVIQKFDSHRICSYMQKALESLVDALEQSPSKVVRELEVLPNDERETLLESWNATATTYQQHLCIHHLFENQAEQTPDAIAVVYEDNELTYRELNERSNSLAHHLVELGVKPDSLVAICISRSVEMMIGLMAVLKAGGAYVPLDPTFASERLNVILEDASPSILLADGTGLEALNLSVTNSIVIVNPIDFIGISITNPYIKDLMPHHLAYVIYTSGSTGKPKGVMIEHQNVIALAESRASVFIVDSSSRVLQFFSISFDGSVHDIWSALCFGGSLHIPSDRVRQDRNLLWSYLEEHCITHALVTPSVLQDCKDLTPLHTSITLAFGGEALSLALLKTLRILIPNGSILNDYGPTETTVDAIFWRCPKDYKEEFAPIGKPHPNKRVYVLDLHKRLIPTGAVGELYIAGSGIARGYLNQPDLTEKSFLPDTFVGATESRMYKTGDLVRYLPDGNLMYLGRSDHQVKIRGYRIELGEIEILLSEHVLVREAVVKAIGEGTSKRLVAYVIADSKDDLALILRSHISSKLPEYMIPAAFVRLDAFPLTPN
ncbi:hypothetical protein BGZ76_005976, partial [Entomortierella beljakovae]